MAMKTRLMVWLVLCGLGPAYAQKGPVIQHVSVAEFRTIMDSLGEEVVVDVRTPAEIQKGKIPGAIGIDFRNDNFRSSLQQLDRDKPYLVYCAGGVRSGQAVEIMEEMGFKRVYNLEGGYQDWVKRKMPVTVGKP